MDGKRERLFTLRAGKELLFDYFSGTGPGGQNRNKKKKCVRLTHPGSGVTVRATEERSKKQNERVAMQRLVADSKFMAWVKLHAAMIMQGFRDLEDKVDKMLRNSSQTKVEYLTTFTCDKCGDKAKTTSPTQLPVLPRGWHKIGEDTHHCTKCKEVKQGE
jgi:hypothetical protein